MPDETLPPDRATGFPPIQVPPPQVMPATKPDPDATMKWVRWGALAVLAAIPTVLWLLGKGPQPDQPLVIPPLPIEAKPALNPVGSAPPPAINTSGWVRDDEAVREVMATLPFKTFQDTPQGQDQSALPKAVYQWQATQKVTGSPPPKKNQNPIGSCVGFGNTTAVEKALACGISSGSIRDQFTFFSEEITYAGSRVQIGKGQIRSDGSVGAWAAKFWLQFGGLPVGQYGRYDFRQYDPDRCRKLGSSGVPAELLEKCKPFAVGDVTRVTTTEQLKRGLANGCGAATCSVIGFNQTRDANGICSPGPQWGHCMNVDGYVVADNGRLYFHFENSWDDLYHRGPVGYGNPTSAGFWAAESVVQQMLDENDSWLYSSVKGFHRRQLDAADWFADGRNFRVPAGAIELVEDFRRPTRRVIDLRPEFALDF